VPNGDNILDGLQNVKVPNKSAFSIYKITKWLSKRVLIGYNYSKNRTWKAFETMNPECKTLKAGFNGIFKLEFHGAQVTWDGISPAVWLLRHRVFN